VKLTRASMLCELLAQPAPEKTLTSKSQTDRALIALSLGANPHRLHRGITASAVVSASNIDLKALAAQIATPNCVYDSTVAPRLRSTSVF